MGRREKGKGGGASAKSAMQTAETTKRPAIWKRPVPRTVAIFAVCVAAFYAVRVAPVFLQHVFDPYLRINATASAWVLDLFGERASARDTTVTGRRYQLSINRGCDALEPSALFAAAVIAFPVAFRRRIAGLLIGVGLLAALNLVRIISLYYTGVHFPKAFEIMHVDVWQPVFILVAVLLWAAWAWWALRPRAEPSS